jgi:cellulose synthase/poly-beta-1,6-N-acetylglucosamine synthase-like glycosyltransferase
MLDLIKWVFWLSLFAIVYSYSLYPLLLIIFSRLFGKPVRKDNTFTPSVGVLVPVHNEEAVIRKKIENILSLDYPEDKLSIWIGSDQSTDRTEEYVKAFNNPRIHLWRSPVRAGKTGILNSLAPQIDAEIILFTDANTMHQKDCLGAIACNFADPSIGGVAGHIEHVMKSEHDDQFGESLYRKFESKQKFMEGMLHSTISAFGGFYAIRKSLFRPIPPNSYSNDDVLIPMNIIRQNFRVIYEPLARSVEDTTGKVITEFHRRVRIGAGNFQAFSWLIDFLNPLRGWPFFCYISHKVSRWFSPFFFATAAVSSLLLSISGQETIYRMLFAAGSIFLVTGILHKVIKLRITRHIYYFLMMNIALILGFLRFLCGIKSAAWSRTERN